MVRKKVLDDEQRKLGAILRIYNQQVDKMNNSIKELNILKVESEKYLQNSLFDPMTISNYATYIRKMQEDIKVQKTMSEKTEEVLAMQRERIKKAYIEVESLENLKEKQKEQYLKELQLEEIKETDDIVNSRRNIA